MPEFGTFTYSAAALLYATLTVLLATGWRGRRAGGVLIGACTISTVWAILLAYQASAPNLPVILTFVIEILRGGAWLTFLVMLLARMGVGRPLRYAAHGLWISVLLSGIGLWLWGGDSATSLIVGLLLIPGGLLMALAGLVLIEQLFRNSVPDARWALQALALGLGGLFAYDLFLYSQGLLFGVIDSTTWMARGAVNVLFIPLIAIAARRNPDWDLNVFVSRQIVFFSTSLVAVGLYLLLMSLGGYALLMYGGTWGGLLQIVFFAGAILVLVTLLFSHTLRARAKVFLSKHFFQNKYDYREEWLRLIATLTDSEERSTRRIVIRAMAQIVESPGGWLWVYDDNERAYHMIESDNCDHPAPNVDVDDSLIQFIKQEGWLIDLQEFDLEPERYGGLILPGWLAEDDDAWLIVPLLLRQELLGLVMLRKAAGPPKLNYEDRDLLKTAGHHLAVHLAQEKADSLLAEARQFEAYNRLTAFLMHDLNNLIAQQSLIIKNAEKHRRNPEFVDDAIKTIANSVRRMKRVMQQLTRGEADRLSRNANLRSMVANAVDRCAGGEPTPELDIDDETAAVSVDEERFTMVLTHLIKNAQDATDPQGSVAVSIRNIGANVEVTVVDSGCGMTPQFVRDHLFRPFDSTKGSQGMGIGAYQAREFAREMGGELKVWSSVAEGTRMHLSLPIAELRK